MEALFLRFDFQLDMIPEEYIAGYLWSMPFSIVSTIVVYYIYKLYHSIWAFFCRHYGTEKTYDGQTWY